MKLITNIMTDFARFGALMVIILLTFFIAYLFEKIAKIKQGDNTRVLDVRKLAIIGVFSAIAFGLMLFEFPLPFAPSFYEFDFSDIPALIGGFAAGPLAAVMIEFIKVLMNLIFQGTNTAFVGEIANFVVGAAFVLPATIIYRFKKTRKTAFLGCLCGALCITVTGSLLNAYFLLPTFAAMWGSGIDTFIGMGAEINPAINNLLTFCLFAVAPFNLLKGVVDSIVTFLVYKKLSPILKHGFSKPAQNNNKKEA